MSVWWRLLGPGGRGVPEGAEIHASVAERISADNSYKKRLPAEFTFVDPGWRTARPWRGPAADPTTARREEEEDEEPKPG